MKLSKLESLTVAYNVMIHDDRFSIDACKVILDEIIVECRKFGVDWFFKDNGTIILN
jgi:hypothetical protein